ncbi:Thioesterase/thiol ester dehydrase-isomerase [Paramyrothecium foliicola]|nr:Thioesterase/thiol ester dehydrase-isomerase [Paramyrothecium foliicola]
MHKNCCRIATAFSSRQFHPRLPRNVSAHQAATNARFVRLASTSSNSAASSTPIVNSSETVPFNAELSSRWLADLRSRVEKLRTDKSASEHREELNQILDKLQTNWQELLAGRDGFLVGHVNNVIYNRWAESSRVNTFRNLALSSENEDVAEWLELMTPRGVGLIMKSIKTEYKFPVTFPDQITVVHQLTKEPDLDSTSLQFRVAMYSERHKREVARCWEDIVIYDYRRAKKATLEPHFIERLRLMYALQMQAKKDTDAILAPIFERVADLEESQT